MSPASLLANHAGAKVPQMKPTPVDAYAGREDFSLVLGGPLYQLLLRLRLVRPPLQLLYRRLILSPLLAWVPLLVLAVVDGRATGRVAMPFLSDIGIYARFLVAMPLLILIVVILFRPQGLLGRLEERTV